MKRLGASLLLVSILAAGVAFAQFRGGMTPTQLKEAVEAQVKEGKSAADIAKALLDANIPAGNAATAMILAGIGGAGDPKAGESTCGGVGVVVEELIRAGAAAVPVMNAALGAGASADTVSCAAIAAGANPTLVANVIAAAGEAAGGAGQGNQGQGRGNQGGNQGGGGGRPSRS